MISDLKHNINFNLIYNKLSFHCRFLVVIVSISSIRIPYNFWSLFKSYLFFTQVVTVTTHCITIYTEVPFYLTFKYISILESEWKFSKVCIFGYWHWNNEHDLYTKFLTTTNRSLKNIILVSTLHIAPRYINMSVYILIKNIIMVNDQ